MEGKRGKPFRGVFLALRSGSGSSCGSLSPALFKLFSGEGQDLICEVAEVPDVVEILKDALDEGPRLGVVGAHKPQHPRRVPRRGIVTQLLEGLVNFFLAAIPPGQGRTRLRLVAPD